MAKVERLEKVIAVLRARAARAVTDTNVSVIVGYTAAYALFVHENMEMRLKGQPRRPPHKGRYWDPQGRAGPKFLEGPARELAGVLGDIVMQALKKGKTMAQGLLLAGLRLQREAMLRTPVETGNLKASAFTRLEK